MRIYGKLSAYRHGIVMSHRVDNEDLYPFVRDTNPRAIFCLLVSGYRPGLRLLRKPARCQRRFKSVDPSFTRTRRKYHERLMLAFDRPSRFPPEVTPRSFRN